MKKFLIALMFVLTASVSFAQTPAVITTTTWDNATIVWSASFDTPNDSASVWIQGRYTKDGLSAAVLLDTLGTVLNATTYTPLPSTAVALTNYWKAPSMRFMITDISSNTYYSEYFNAGVADNKSLFFIYKKKTGPNATYLWTYEVYLYCIDPEQKNLK